MTPDPPKESSPISASNDIAQIVNSTDSDDDTDHNVDNIHAGYAILPQQDYIDEPDSEEEESVAEVPSTTTPERSTFDIATAQDVGQVWKDPANTQAEPMDQKLQEEVLEVMKGFTLPPSAIPSWARDLSDEDWKRHILDRIHQAKSLNVI